MQQPFCFAYKMVCEKSAKIKVWRTITNPHLRTKQNKQQILDIIKSRI